MGECADLVLNGDACESCGEPMPGGEGVPRSCRRCEPAQAPPKPARTRHVRCPVCARTFHDEFAMAQHRAMKAH